jgi:hypothetical protein
MRGARMRDEQRAEAEAAGAFMDDPPDPEIAIPT